MRKALVYSFVILFVLVCVTAAVQARELERKVPTLDDPFSRVVSTGTVGAVSGVLGVNQTPTDTFYYGGTVIVGGVPYAAEPSAPGWLNRKMWTWDAGGFNGIPHSGLNMDGWFGIDKSTQTEDYFRVTDNATMGQPCVIAGTKSLFCGATNAECIALCYADQNGTGYGNNWYQTVVTKTYTYSAGNQITLNYDYRNQSEPGDDFTDVILQIWDGGAWVDHETMAEYTDIVNGHETLDVDSYLGSLTPPVDFRVRFTFSSDVGYSDEDGNYTTACGAFELDNYVLDINGTPDSENFEGVAVGDLPAGWSRLVLGCGDYAKVKHLNDLPIGLSEDPCVVQLGEQVCEIADSVLVFIDEAHPSYPHPHHQDNCAQSPAIDVSAHPELTGRILHCERFGKLPLGDLIFMYWQVRHKPGCASGGWSPWVSDNYVYYTPEGTGCRPFDFDLSTFVPPSAQQVQVAWGVLNVCEADPWGTGCSYVCNATPYYDNVTFGVFGSDVAPYVSMRELDFWQDQFAEDGTLSATSTSDTRVANYLSNLMPPIFGDTLTCRGPADNIEVRFVFRMNKVGPRQPTTHPFFTTWFPGVTGGSWKEARMDTAEITSASGTSTVPVQGQWMCAFHEDDPVRTANALPEGKEILPNNLFVPGTRVEYFVKARYIGSGDWFLLPDTSNASPLVDKFEEFSVLPMFRESYGSLFWPCFIVVDHFGRRGNGGETNGHRIARHLDALGYPFDVYHRLGPNSDLRNGIGRWADNPGQIGGPGTDKYCASPGATINQFLAYEYCILNAGSVYGYSMYQPDVNMISDWLNLYTSPYPCGVSRFFWLSGDQVVRELNRRVSWGRNFLNKTLCATYVHSNYAAQNNDYTFCLPVNYVAGGRVPCGDPAPQYVVRQNGCPRTYSVIGISLSTGCNAIAEREYDSQPVKSYAAVSNVVSGGVPHYKTFTEGYDFCVIRSDGSQGPLVCGADDFLTDWLSCPLTWASYNPNSWCPGGDCWVLPEATVTWHNLACDSTRVLVCPASSHVPPNDTCLTTWIHVLVKDQFSGEPLAGVSVYAEFNSRCAVRLCSAASAVTDANGEADISIRAGLDARADTACCPVTTTLTTLGVTVYNETKKWLSPDMNADSVVSVEDASLLNGDLGSSACRSDYNCDGVVDELDWAIFESHYLDGCKSILTGVEETPGSKPTFTALAQNYPNPFNPLSDIEFSVARSGRVTLRVYDIAGRPVQTLVDEWREPGRYKVVWDGTNDRGERVTSGVFFYQLEAAGYKDTRKIVILR